MGKWRPWRQSPWCPSIDDCRFLIEATQQTLYRSRPSATILVLGVTPETIALDWPAHAELIAVDSSADMIAMDWRPHPRRPSHIVQARWEQMPLDDGVVDVAVGDASLNALAAFDRYAPVLEELARVMRPGGLLAARTFLRSESPESCEELIDMATRGAFASGVPFRFRFAMAVAGTGGLLELSRIPLCFDALVPDRDRMAALAGWSREDLDRIDIYANNANRINFPTEAELRALAAPRFDLATLRYPTDYLAAERCPTAVLKRR